MIMCSIDVDFDEFAAETYRAVRLRSAGETVTRFASGDPIADFATANQAARDAGCTRWNEGNVLCYLSFTEHFASDSLFYALEADDDDFWSLRLTTQAERVKEVQGWLSDLTRSEYEDLAADKIIHAPVEIQWALSRNLLTEMEAQVLCNLLTTQAQEKEKLMEETTTTDVSTRLTSNQLSAQYRQQVACNLKTQAGTINDCTPHLAMAKVDAIVGHLAIIAESAEICAYSIEHGRTNLSQATLNFVGLSGSIQTVINEGASLRASLELVQNAVDKKPTTTTPAH